MKSFEEIHDILFHEHEVEYTHFTRLLLSLSVAFITIITALKSGGPEFFGQFQKMAIVAHSLSIIFGVWLQYLNTAKPLKDMERVVKLYETSEEIINGKGVYFSRPPWLLQTICFRIQIALFLLAFVLIVASIYNA